MRNRVILFAIGAEVMGDEWGLTHVAGEICSIPISYGGEMDYLLKSCSTKRLIDIRVKTIDAGEAIVHTTEYRYLRWWDTKKLSYVYPYRETNRQTYIVKQENGTWKVFQNLRPSPRSSAPNRRAKSSLKG